MIWRDNLTELERNMEKRLYWYMIYGTVFCSEAEYPHLVETDIREAEAYIRLVGVMEGETGDDYENRIFVINKKKIHFGNSKGSFMVTEGRYIDIHPNSDVPLAELNPFVFGYCMAMLFWQRGRLAIHCSTVNYNGSALIISGGSGSGKSTLTARFLDCGSRLMTDDVAILETVGQGEIMVYPGFPQQKLCRDAVGRNKLDTKELLYIDEDKDKFAVDRREGFSTEPVRLGAMVCLNRYSGKEVRIRELSGHEKLDFILENQFLRPMFENSCEYPPEDMKQSLIIAMSVPVYEVLRPIKGDTTAEQLRLITARLP